MPVRRRSGARLRPSGGTRRSFGHRPRCAPRLDAFQPQDAGLVALTKRVKDGFDPKGVLNPGRMWAGSVGPMQTTFSLAQLADPKVAESEKILRTCVHCGFCTATCPTYVLLGDELDSPRGRIYLIKEMLEHDAPATPEVVKHIDRCLSCLACMTTCPSGVHYMHLVDHARGHIEQHLPAAACLTACCARLLAAVLPDDRRFRAALTARPSRAAAGAAAVARGAQAGCGDAAAGAGTAAGCRRGHPPSCVPAEGPLPGTGGPDARLRHPRDRAFDQRSSDSRPHPPRDRGGAAGRAGLLRRARPAHGPRARLHSLPSAATSMPGTRRPRGMGSTPSSSPPRAAAPRSRTTDSCCALTPPTPPRPAQISALAKDICEYLAGLELRPQAATQGFVAAYHGACSLQHGQKITREPKELLSKKRLRSQRCAGRTFVLWIGGNLQHSSVGHR